LFDDVTNKTKLVLFMAHDVCSYVVPFPRCSKLLVENQQFYLPPAFDARVRSDPIGSFSKIFGVEKWLPWLPCSVDSLMTVLVILTQCQRVMGRQTQVLYQYHTLHSCAMLKHAKTILFTLSLKWPIIWQVRYEACSLTCCLLCLDLRNRLLDCFVLNYRMLFLNTVLSL